MLSVKTSCVFSIAGRSACRCAVRSAEVYGKCVAPYPAIASRAFCFSWRTPRIGVVHGFVKKTQKAPADAIALAAKRMKEMKK